MNRKKILNELTDVELKERVPIIQRYLQKLDEQEREKYREFYQISIKALKQNKGVTQTETRLLNQGHLSFAGSLPYYMIHQISCVATEHQIRTPKLEMIMNGLRTEHSIVRESNGRREGKIASQRQKRRNLRKKLPHDI